MRGRTTFSVGGRHPLLLLVRDYLIREKRMVLVPWSSDPDFVLYGAALCKDERLFDALHRASLEVSEMSKKPAIVLSTSSMHRTGKETDDYSLSSKDQKALFSLTIESLFSKESLILRPFNVYGPDVTTGVVHTFLDSAKRQSQMDIRGNGYQKRSFLHQNDFLTKVGELLGKTGTYQIGTAEEPISMLRLADCVWKTVHGAESTPRTAKVRHKQDFDSQEKFVCTSTKSSISLRKGIWLMKP